MAFYALTICYCPTSELVTEDQGNQDQERAKQNGTAYASHERSSESLRVPGQVNPGICHLMSTLPYDNIEGIRKPVVAGQVVL